MHFLERTEGQREKIKKEKGHQLLHHIRFYVF